MNKLSLKFDQDLMQTKSQYEAKLKELNGRLEAEQKAHALTRDKYA